MTLNIFKNTVLLFVLAMISCANLSHSKADIQEQNLSLNTKNIASEKSKNKRETQLNVGANRTNVYLPLLENKKIGIVANQTSVIFKNSEHTKYTHLVDSLKSLHVDIKKVFAPEHGFRGKADAGELVKDDIDTKTGLPIVSFYGKNKKPSKEQLVGIDLVLFDIQDVGARFYTYISSLHYVMEACAEQNIPLIVLDRPNPNGHYIDGPILKKEHKSFIGMHPIPTVHGMTIGEYAKMINGEKWLANAIVCDLTIINIENYDRNKIYKLPIKPSPNLPNDQSINLYPSLCFFEGTNVNAGRGTDMQFQVYGSPFLDKSDYNFQYTPKSNPGAKHPKHENKLCYGNDLREYEALNTINLEWLIDAYEKTSDKSQFFSAFFTKLAGTKKLQQQIESGLSQSEIKSSWTEGLEKFKATRANYLLYP